MEKAGENATTVFVTEKEARKFHLFGLRPGRPPGSTSPNAETAFTAWFSRRRARRAGVKEEDIEKHTVEQQDLPV